MDSFGEVGWDTKSWSDEDPGEVEVEEEGVEVEVVGLLEQEEVLEVDVFATGVQEDGKRKFSRFSFKTNREKLDVISYHLNEVILWMNK